MSTHGNSDPSEGEIRPPKQQDNQQALSMNEGRKSVNLLHHDFQRIVKLLQLGAREMMLNRVLNIREMATIPNLLDPLHRRWIFDIHCAIYRLNELQATTVNGEIDSNSRDLMPIFRALQNLRHRMPPNEYSLSTFPKELFLGLSMPGNPFSSTILSQNQPQLKCARNQIFQRNFPKKSLTVDE